MWRGMDILQINNNNNKETISANGVHSRHKVAIPHYATKHANNNKQGMMGSIFSCFFYQSFWREALCFTICGQWPILAIIEMTNTSSYLNMPKIVDGCGKKIVPSSALAWRRRRTSLVMIFTFKLHMRSRRKARLDKSDFLYGTIDHY